MIAPAPLLEDSGLFFIFADELLVLSYSNQLIACKSYFFVSDVDTKRWNVYAVKGKNRKCDSCCFLLKGEKSEV
jgi:hypothetical protein